MCILALSLFFRVEWKRIGTFFFYSMHRIEWFDSWTRLGRIVLLCFVCKTGKLYSRENCPPALNAPPPGTLTQVTLNSNAEQTPKRERECKTKTFILFMHNFVVVVCNFIIWKNKREKNTLAKSNSQNRPESYAEAFWPGWMFKRFFFLPSICLFTCNMCVRSFSLSLLWRRRYWRRSDVEKCMKNIRKFARVCVLVRPARSYS